MKFADQLSLVETLSYYDRPLLEHWKQIDRITLSTTGCPESHEGDMFDGTIEHWVDNYFSNFTVEGAMAFAEEQGVQIKFYGQDFLMVWQDENESAVTWLAVPVTPEILARFQATTLAEAMSLREVLMTASKVFRVTANSFVYDLVEGDELSPSSIPAELLPGEGSYLDHHVFVAWQMAQEKLP